MIPCNCLLHPLEGLPCNCMQGEIMSENPDMEPIDGDKRLEDLGFTVVKPEDIEKYNKRFLRYTNAEETHAVDGVHPYRTTMPQVGNILVFGGQTHYRSPFCWCHPVLERVFSSVPNETPKLMDINVTHIMGTVN